MMTNAQLRRKARESLRPVLPVALLTSLCAQLPTLFASVAYTLSSQPLMQVILAYNESSPMLYSPEKLLADLQAAITPAMKGAWIATLAAFLLTPFLQLGCFNFMFKLLRGEECGVADVFSRVGIFFKALGQMLLLVLKEFLWALPGIGVMLLGMVIVVVSPSMTTLNIMTFLESAGMILIIALMIRAYLHYAMAQYIMADEPEVGVRASIRRSIDMMRPRKSLYIGLWFSFIGWWLLVMYASMLFEGISPVLATTLQMALELGLSVYMSVTFIAFYLDQTGRLTPPKEPVDSAEL